MGAFALGTVLSWSAVALPDMRKDEGISGDLTETAETWIGSIITVSKYDLRKVSRSQGRRIKKEMIISHSYRGLKRISVIAIAQFSTFYSNEIFL